MNILYDHQIFTIQRFGGVSRYFYELIKYFQSDEIFHAKMPMLLSRNHYFSEGKIAGHLSFSPRIHIKGEYAIYSWINELSSKAQLSLGQYDILHPTYFDPYFLNYLNGKPFVLTIYDMIHEKFPQLYSVRDKDSDHKKLLASKADRIIAISENTKTDIIDILKVEENKIDVVYLGNSLTSSEKRSPDRPSEDYILYVGNRNRYKNFVSFIRAASKIAIDSGLKIICAGGLGFTRAEKHLFAELGLENRVEQHPAHDQLLAELYQNALFFVFPSLYEGFGLPLLESFACGCPVACSNTGSLPEVAGDAAVYFDPYSEISIASAIMSLAEDVSLRSSLKQEGTKRLEKFSWKATAQRTKAVYEKVL